MLLQALVGHQGSKTPPGYAFKTLSFVLEVSWDGANCRLISLLQPRLDRNQKPTSTLVGQEALVPNITRSNNPPPMLACDKAAFVLALTTMAKDPARQAVENAKAKAQQNAFMALLRDYEADNHDESAASILAWHQAGNPGLANAIGALGARERKRLETDLVALRTEDDPQRLHDRPAAQAFWGRRALASKSGAGSVGLCLCCGQIGPLVDTLPQSLEGRLIPATSKANVALLSANFSSAQRGASGKGLRSAPLCAICAIAAVNSFNTLASSDRHRWGRPSEDRATIWWLKGGRGEDEEAAEQVEDPKPQWVAQFLETLNQPSTRTGRDPAVARFFALTFSGNASRLVVRGWIDLPLVDFKQHVGDWFRDVQTSSKDRPFPSISATAKSLGVMLRRDGRWTEPAPEGARDALLRTAVAGEPVPRHFLRLAVGRAKAEVSYLASSDGLTAGIARRRMHARLGLIRLILNRTAYREDPMPSHLNIDRDDKPYLSGRLFAVRESLQHRAVAGVNASIADRYFDRSASHPASVDANLTTLEKQHVRALQRAQSTRGAAVHFDKLLTELHARLGDAPGRLSIEQQAAWISGYYQQRQHDFDRFAESKAERARGGVPPMTPAADEITSPEPDPQTYDMEGPQV